jgi:hypothetical protein
VLIEAIHSLLGGHRGGRPNRQEWRRARRWLLDLDDRWPFSFRAICRELDLDARLLRQRILTSMAPHSNLLAGMRRSARPRRRDQKRRPTPHLAAPPAF